MQACLENTALPLLESTPLPLLKSTSRALMESTSLPLAETLSRPSVDAAPAWTIRVARPISPNRNELAKELLEVPKAALRQVFGKVLGTRLWQQNRAVATPPRPVTKAAPVAAISATAPISDVEISSAMLHYLCAEAAATLCEHKRFAKSIALTVQHSDGQSETVRQSLPQTANDAASVETAARLAVRRMRSNIFVSLKLDVTATASACASQSLELAATAALLTRVA
jgi:impB/mucB/samB family C-terminal domain